MQANSEQGHAAGGRAVVLLAMDAQANAKGLKIAWSTDEGKKTYHVWERVPKKVSTDVGGRLLLIDADADQLAKFIDAFEPESE